MEKLGLKATAQSGAGWLEKEDGYDDKILCQLKSTDANSFRLEKLDLEKLEYHADGCGKLPMFVIQFLKLDETYVMCKMEDMKDILAHLEGKEVKVESFGLGNAYDGEKKAKKKVISSSSNARDKFYKQREKEYKSRK